MKTAVLATLALMTALPAAAQTDTFALRPYGMITYQAFSAKTTFDAEFGQSSYPFWGAGAELVLPKHIYIDVSASRFKKTGQRAFLNNGQVSELGVPLTASITPFEVAGGYRFVLARYPGVIPFAGAGVGWYSYTQTSDFAEPGENVDATHVGALIVGGVEFRVHPWIRLSGDVQYTHIPGILGTDPDALSTAANEHDLGGVAARFKFIVGR